jgi:hypothetical protein
MQFCKADPVHVEIGDVGNKVNSNITQVVRVVEEE